jgi:hypothetical protein
MAGRFPPAIFFGKSRTSRCLDLARDWPSPHLVTFRQRLARTFAGTLLVLATFIAVGLTAPADGPFTIGITPVFLRLDAAAVAESRARALGLEVDIKCWTLHLHFAWSAIPLALLAPPSTKPAGALL